MSDTMTREERLQVLDDFAVAGPAPTTQLPAVTTTAALPEMPNGALPISGALRDERTVLRKIAVLAAQAGDEFVYRYPVTDNRTNQRKYIEGLSIIGAEAVASVYGNCYVRCDCIAEGHDYYEFMGRIHDAETGFRLERPLRARKGAAKLGKDRDRNLDTDYLIGVSKATRNVITNALGVYCNFAFEQAKGALAERVEREGLPKWHAKIADRLAELDIAQARADAIIGKPLRDWLAPDIAKAITLIRGITDGMALAKETFPPLGEPDEREQLNAELDRFAKGSAPDPVIATTVEPPSPSALPEPAAGEPLGKTPAAVRQVYTEMIAKLLQLATDTQIDVSARLEQLDQAGPWWEDQLPSDHHQKVATVISTAAKVARGNLSKEDARKYLAAL